LPFSTPLNDREKIMDYVDGFVLAVLKDNKEQYIAHARKAAAVFKDHGALQLVECWGDDVPEGTLTSFPMAVKCQENETVVFSWIVWPSKTVRDAGMEKAMQDPRLNSPDEPMPFDGKRMIFGGFQMVVNE
jgi:uncharacterized protein YbaA (DUF1428 family)